MSTVVHFRPLGLCFVSLILSAMIAGSCHAVPMTVKVGFDGAAKTALWTPIAVELTNPTDENIEGLLQAEQSNTQGRMPVANCSARVVLPAGSRKLYHIYTRLGEYGGELQVTLSRGMSLYALKRVSVSPVQPRDKMIVSVGARSAALSFLNGETVPAKPLKPSSTAYPGYSGPQDANLRPGSIAAKALPDRPQAYESIDLLVLSDLTPSAVDGKALRALSMWVASGGTVVVPTGADYRHFVNEFYDELLPVTVEGAVDLPGMPALSALGKGQFPAGAVTVAKGVVKPGIGRVMAAEGGVPLVVDRSYGAGRVIYLAFDNLGSPFKDWSGQVDFWKNIIRSSGGDVLVGSTMSAVDYSGGVYYGGNRNWVGQPGTISGLVVQNPSIQAPSFNTIGIFLLAYLICLVPVNYLVLKRKGRLELAWVSTPAIVLVFALAAYGIGYTMKGGDLQINEATVIEGSSEARYARVVTDASLFSPARRSYDIAVADPYSISQVVPNDENERLPDTYIEEKSTIEGVGMAMWSSKTFESASGVDLGGCVRSRLALNGGRLSGTVTNDTGTVLKQCVLVYGGRSAAIGDLGKGDSANIDVIYKRSGSTPAPAGSQLSTNLVGFARNAAGSAGTPVLVCRPAVETRVFDPQRGASVDSATCCIIRLGYRMMGSFVIDGGRFTCGVVKLDSATVEGPQTGVRSGNANVALYSHGTAVLAFRLSDPGGASIRRITVHTTERGTGRPPKNTAISLQNQVTGKWDPVDYMTPTPVNAADYVRGGSEVRVKLEHQGGIDRSISIGLSAEGMAR